jgi:hypothetical protein
LVLLVARIQVVGAHGVDDPGRQAPLPGDMHAQFVQGHPQHAAGGVRFTLSGLDGALDARPFLRQIKGCQQLADAMQQGADHAHFAVPDVRLADDGTGDGTGHQAVGQLPFGGMGIRVHLPKRTDQLDPQGQVSHRLEPQNAQRVGDGGNTPADGRVHGGIGQAQHLLGKGYVGQHGIDQGRGVLLADLQSLDDLGHGMIQGGESPAFIHAPQDARRQGFGGIGPRDVRLVFRHQAHFATRHSPLPTLSLNCSAEIGRPSR